ncbi:MAG: MATE family efflux transporter [Paludibacteraceae bacterium]|nr:MATE family efflux transporter [Paludibacteraceae bacterium]
MGVVEGFQSYKPFYIRNLKIAIPAVLSQLGQGVVMIADSMMVGVLGTNELAAASFAGAIVIVGFLFVLGVTFGATPLVGRQYSMGKHVRAASLFQNSILLDMLVVALVCGILYVLSFFLDKMGQELEVCVLARPYYLWLVASLPPLFVFQAFKQFMEGLGNTKVAMVITLISNALNVLLNYLFIFGKCGCPFMGVEGAGVATFIARLVMPIMFYAYFVHRKSLFRYFRFFRMRVFSFAELYELGKIGVPIGFQMLVETSTFSLSAVMVGWFGAVSLASHQIAMNLSSLTFMMASGISAATTIRVSHQMGAKDYVSMRKAGFASMHLCVFENLIFAVLMIVFRREIPLAFTSDPLVVELSAMLLVMCAIYQLADGLQVVALGALRGMADVEGPMRVSVICYVLVSLPVAYICGVVLDWGAVGVWMGFIVSLNLAAILLIRRFLKMSSTIINASMRA